MMNIITAKRLAEGFIKTNIQASETDRYLIVDIGVKESENGWYFPFQTELFLKTGDIQYSVVGNWPIFVSKDGSVVEQRRPINP